MQFVRVLIFFLALFHSGFSFAGENELKVVIHGNFHGKTSIQAEDGSIGNSLIWRIPDLIKDLRRNGEFQTLVVGAGNESSVFDPVSFFLKGKVEESLAMECGIDARTLGPGDLQLFYGKKNYCREFFSRIWTNVLKDGNTGPFVQTRIIKCLGKRIAVGCIISESLLSDVPLKDFGDISVEDPIRAYNRLRFETRPVDLLFLVSHLDLPDLKRILEEADSKTRILWVIPDSCQGQTSRLKLKKHDRRLIKVPDGTSQIMALRFWVSKSELIDEKEHIFPLEKLSRKSVSKIFSKVSRMIFALTEMTIGSNPPVSDSFPAGISFSPERQADLARSFFNADISLLGCPSLNLNHAGTLTLGSLFKLVPNRFLRDYSFGGDDLKRLLIAISRANLPFKIGLAGARISFLGGNLRGITLKGMKVNDSGSFRVVLDHDLFRIKSFEELLRSSKRIGIRGFTLWDALETEFKKDFAKFGVF